MGGGAGVQSALMMITIEHALHLNEWVEQTQETRGTDLRILRAPRGTELLMPQCCTFTRKCDREDIHTRAHAYTHTHTHTPF